MEAQERKRVRVNLKLDPTLHRDVKIDAAKRGLTIQEYVSRLLNDVAVERREPFSDLQESA